MIHVRIFFRIYLHLYRHMYYIWYVLHMWYLYHVYREKITRSWQVCHLPISPKMSLAVPGASPATWEAQRCKDPLDNMCLKWREQIHRNHWKESRIAHQKHEAKIHSFVWKCPPIPFQGTMQPPFRRLRAPQRCHPSIEQHRWMRRKSTRLSKAVLSPWPLFGVPTRRWEQSTWYVHVYIYILYMCICICVYIYIYMYVYMCICVYVCMYKYMYIMCICIYVTCAHIWCYVARSFLAFAHTLGTLRCKIFSCTGNLVTEISWKKRVNIWRNSRFGAQNPGRVITTIQSFVQQNWHGIVVPERCYQNRGTVKGRRDVYVHDNVNSVCVYVYGTHVYLYI